MRCCCCIYCVTCALKILFERAKSFSKSLQIKPKTKQIQRNDTSTVRVLPSRRANREESKREKHKDFGERKVIKCRTNVLFINDENDSFNGATKRSLIIETSLKHSPSPPLFLSLSSLAHVLCAPSRVYQHTNTLARSPACP